MIGSTLINESDETKLIGIDIEQLDGFTILHLDSLLTLDFETMTQEGGVSWAGGEPLHYDEESGMALLRISEDGIKFVCEYSGDLNNIQKEDQNKIKKFIEKYGSKNIYELATF